MKVKIPAPCRNIIPLFQTTARPGYLRPIEQRSIMHEIITAGHGWIGVSAALLTPELFKTAISSA